MGVSFLMPLLVLRPVPDAAEEPALERIHGNDYVVRGEVAEVDGDELLLQVVDRRVRVLLDGRGVPGGEQSLVEVRGTMIG